MYCQHCGERLPEDAEKCPVCFKPVPVCFRTKTKIIWRKYKHQIIGVVPAVMCFAGGVGLGYLAGNHSAVVSPYTKTETTAFSVPESSQISYDKTVYITPNGSKYHRKSCRFVKKNGIEKKLSEVKKSYDPCSVCNP